MANDLLQCWYGNLQTQFLNKAISGLIQNVTKQSRYITFHKTAKLCKSVNSNLTERIISPRRLLLLFSPKIKDVFYTHSDDFIMQNIITQNHITQYLFYREF